MLSFTIIILHVPHDTKMALKEMVAEIFDI